MRKTALLFLLVFTLLACTQVEKTYHDNGELYQEFTLDDQGDYHGPYKAYSEEGYLFEEATYDHGDLIGTRTIYYPTGAREIVEQYKDGQIEGAYTKYYESGQIELEANYVGGAMNGLLTTYYPDGEIHEEVTMSSNVEDGPFKEYHENGALHWEGTFHEGDNEVGLLLEYDTSGTLIKKMMCDDRSICQTIWTLADGDVTSTPIEELLNE